MARFSHTTLGWATRRRLVGRRLGWVMPSARIRSFGIACCWLCCWTREFPSNLFRSLSVTIWTHTTSTRRHFRDRNRLCTYRIHHQERSVFCWDLQHFTARFSTSLLFYCQYFIPVSHVVTVFLPTSKFSFQLSGFQHGAGWIFSMLFSHIDGVPRLLLQSGMRKRDVDKWALFSSDRSCRKFKK